MSEAETVKKRSRTMFRLSARQVETTTQPGIYMDGGGLLMRVTTTGSKKWLFRFLSPDTGKRREMGLGRADKGHVSLAAAREAAQRARDLVGRKLDPIDQAGHDKAERHAEASKTPPKTFGEFAEEWLAQNEGQFRNVKHRAQWRSTLLAHANGLWDKAPSAITTDDVVAALKPIWQRTPETAKRTQGRIERILNAARAAGLTNGDNPARWRGHLDTLLPRRRAAKHHAALPYASAPEFVRALRRQEGIAARALEFLILTGARSGEVRGMTWAEVDSEQKTWTVPEHRMKARRQHRVPLNERAREILAGMIPLRPADNVSTSLVFPGSKETSPLSDMTLAAVLKRMRKVSENMEILLRDERGADVTVHGFRSTFRDWAEDVARFPARVVEAALAHTIKDKAEAAYRRGDAFDMRIELMVAWEAYLGSGSTNGTSQPAPMQRTLA